jgi:hypothetical protein
MDRFNTQPVESFERRMAAGAAHALQPQAFAERVLRAA